MNQKSELVEKSEMETSELLDITVPNDMKKKYEQLENYQELKEELKKMCRMKAKIISVIIGPQL